MEQETIEQLEYRKDELVKRYIGTWNKPMSYYNCLEVINRDIDKLKRK